MGGYGHQAAAETLEECLDHEVVVRYPLQGEEIYNMLARNCYHRTMNAMVRAMGPRVMHFVKGKIEKAVEEVEPDVLVSLIPLVQFPASEVARKAGIPFRVITTDYDLTNWVYGMEKIEHEDVRVTIGVDLPTTRGLLLDHGVKDEQIFTIGLPLNPRFLKEQEKKRGDRPAVTIMMSGQGSEAVVTYAKALLEMGDVEVKACVGKHEGLGDKLSELGELTVVPFTREVPELMAVTDLLITRPGPGVVTEAFAMRLPLLLDLIHPVLFWEQANVALAMKEGVGLPVTDIEHVPALVRRLLDDSDLQRRYDQVPRNRFCEKIGDVIA